AQRADDGRAGVFRVDGELAAAVGALHGLEHGTLGGDSQGENRRLFYRARRAGSTSVVGGPVCNRPVFFWGRFAIRRLLPPLMSFTSRGGEDRPIAKRPHDRPPAHHHPCSPSNSASVATFQRWYADVTAAFFLPSAAAACSNVIPSSSSARIRRICSGAF